MANIFKKLIAGSSILAMLASLSVPVMAEETYVDWDFTTTGGYTAQDAVNDWHEVTDDGIYGATSSVSENGIQFVANPVDRRVMVGYRELETAVSTTALVSYDVMYNRTSTGNTDTSSFVLSHGKSVRNNGKPSDIIFQLDFSTDTNNTTFTAKINDGNTNPVIEGAQNGGWLHVENILDFDGKMVITTITDEQGEELYKGTGNFNSYSATDLSMVYMSVGKRGWTATLKNFKVIESEIPDDIVLEEALKNLEITDGQMGMTFENDVYYIKRDIALPAAPRGAEVAWTLSQKAIDDTSENWGEATYASVSDSVLSVHPDEGSESYYVKATAEVTVGDLCGTKDFLFVVVPMSEEEAAIKYDESFDNFETGTLVNLTPGYQSNTNYSASNCMSFTCGQREVGGGDAVGAIIIADGNNKYLRLVNSNYTGMGRRPIATLTRIKDQKFENGVVINAKLAFAANDDVLIIQDSYNNSIVISLPENYYPSQYNWLNCNIYANDERSIILIKDSDGNIVNYYTTSGIKNVSSITLDDTNASTVNIDDLYIADSKREVPILDIYDIPGMKIGTEKQIAFISNVKDKTIYLTENDSFSYYTEDNDYGTAVYIKADENGKQGDSCTITITITTDNNEIITRSFKISMFKENAVAFGSCTDTVEWYLYDTGLLEITGTGDLPYYTSKYDEPWEPYIDQITDLIVDNGITGIGQYNFYGLINLKNVSLPDTLTYIDYRAFSYCYELTNIYIPDSVTIMGSYVFNRCDSLKSIRLSENAELSTYELYGCTALENISIPDGVSVINPAAFEYCINLKSVELPSSLNAIGPDAFKFCVSLKDIYYAGSEDEWNNINIQTSLPDDVTIHFNYSSQDDENINTSSEAERTGSNIVVTTTADENINDKLLHIALYDSAGLMLDHIMVPTKRSEKTAYVVFKDDPSAKYAKVFIWDSITDMIPEGKAETVTIE